MVYLTKDEIKGHSKIAYTDLGYATDALYDTFLDTIIGLADGIIDNYCRVPAGFFDAAGLALSNELLDFCYPWLSLRYFPVLSVSKVEYNSSGYGQTASWVTIVEPDYIVKLPEGLAMLVNKTPAVLENSVRVSYTAGYSAVPSAIKQVAIQLCCNALHVILQRKINPIIRQGEFTLRLLSSDILTRELQTVLSPFVHRQTGTG
jgi:hypothetical protein